MMLQLKKHSIAGRNVKEGIRFAKTACSIFALLLASAFINSETRAAPGVTSSPEGVSIRVQQVPLRDLLLSIESESGIRFLVDESLFEESVSADIQAPTWTDAVLDLLDDINRIELWNDDDTLASVRLIGNKDWGAAPVQTSKATTGRRNTGVRSKPSSNQSTSSVNITLTEGQLRELAKGPYRSPLPEKFYRDSAYRDFLGKYGINSLEDMKERKKAMRVRREARKQLRILRKQAQANK